MVSAERVEDCCWHPDRTSEIRRTIKIRAGTILQMCIDFGWCNRAARKQISNILLIGKQYDGVVRGYPFEPIPINT